MTYTEGYNDGVMEAKYGIYATEANAAIDQLREAIGVDATEPLAVVDAVLKYVASLERRLWAPVQPSDPSQTSGPPDAPVQGDDR